MKKFKLVILLLLMLVELSAVTDSLFQNANNSYQSGDYETALNTYNEIIKSGFESPDLYYNMGNSAFRSNNIGLAILYFEKCLKMDPSHEDAAHNLEFVGRYRIDTFEEVPELFLRSWTSSFVRLLPERTWSMIAIIGFVLLLGSILLYLFSKRLALKKSGFVIAIFAILIFLVTLSSAISQHRSVVHPAEGIILAPSVIVKSSPSDSGTELFILHEGTSVRIKEEVSGWHNIRVVDGREGWIRNSDFESI